MAIHDVHCCGVAHSDVKADNVMLLPNSRDRSFGIVLLDFAHCQVLEDPFGRSTALQKDADW
jgi:serine/threonine protein kinase